MGATDDRLLPEDHDEPQSTSLLQTTQRRDEELLLGELERGQVDHVQHHSIIKYLGPSSDDDGCNQLLFSFYRRRQRKKRDL